MQFVNAQLKLVETILHVIVNVEIFPEFWHDLMAQQVADVQHNRFADLFRNIQTNQFVGHELLVVVGAFRFLKLPKNKRKISCYSKE